jgi:hypothetical protein
MNAKGALYSDNQNTLKREMNKFYTSLLEQADTIAIEWDTRINKLVVYKTKPYYLYRHKIKNT